MSSSCVAVRWCDVEGQVEETRASTNGESLRWAWAPKGDAQQRKSRQDHLRASG